MNSTQEFVAETASPVPPFRTFVWRVVALHMLTYFVVGLIAFTLLNYRDVYSNTDLRFLMRPTSSPWVAVGPALQVIRGLLFALVLYPFAGRFLAAGRGTFLLWGLFLGLAILGPAGPAPSSLEGVIYTKLPLSLHLLGLPEIVLQTLVFSAGLVAWCRQPARWMNVVAVVGVVIVVLLSGAGILAAI